MADGREIAFTPIRVGKLTIKNRLVAAPMVMNHATEDGHVTPRMIEYYESKAAGGFGLIHVEASYIRPDGNMFGRMLGIYDDRQVPGLSEIAEAIHHHGACCTIQPVFGGRCAPRRFTGVQPVAPSSTTPPLSEAPRELSVAEILELVDCWAQAGRRAKEAGFDGVMIHGAHGFLIPQFVSPYTNHRSDEYGRDRYLLVKQVVTAVRRAVGPDFPIFYRVSADEFLGPAGQTIDETANVYAPLLESLGVDCIDVSAGVQERVFYNIQPLYSPRATIFHLAERVREKVQIPVIGVGRINDPLLIERLLAQGKVDMIALARQSLADPQLPNKMRAGQYDQVRKCIACDMGCSYRHIVQWVADCAINYEVMREGEYRRLLERPTVPKQVTVVGGGPAGLEAARLAALKGHQVTLYEKDAAWGGMLKRVAHMPRVYMAELHNIVDWEVRQLAGLPVTLRLGVEATPDLVRQDGPDVVILACGAGMVPLNVPGADAPQVVGLLDYLDGKATLGQRVAVIGGHEGAEAALSLARQGRQVLLLEAGDHIADAPYLKYVGRQMMLREMLQEAGVQVVTGAQVVRVTATGVVALLDGVEWEAAADTVLVALGRQSDPALIAAWQSAAPRVIAVGDCLVPESVRNAIHTAARAALNL